MALPTSRLPTGDLALRLTTATVGLPLLFLFIWAGTTVVAAVAALAALVALNELFTLLRRAGWAPLPWEGMAWGTVTVGVAALDGGAVLLAFGVGAGASLIVSIIKRRSTVSVGDWFFTGAGVAYVCLPLAALVLLRADDKGIEWVVVAFLATFATDTGAFAVGKLVGRHRMAPSISPGKTWEGAIGGLGAAIGATIGLMVLLEPGAAVIWAAATLGAAIGVISQAGDLLESKLKRLAKAKDSGSIFPGHGGLLDRLDSLVVVFPLVYWASILWPTGASSTP